MRHFLVLAALVLTAACNEQARVPTAPVEAGEPIEWTPPSFAITVGTASTGINSQSGTGTLTIPVPAGIGLGDFLLAQISFEKGNEIDFTRPGTVPAGWTLVRRDHFSSDIGQAIFYKVATGTEPPSYTWGFRKRDNSVLQVRAAGGITPYSGIDPVNPIVGSSGNSGDGTVLTAWGINAEAKSMLVALYSHKKKTTLSNPTGMVSRYHVQHSNQSGPTIRASEELRSANGATGDRVSNANSQVGGDKWVAQLVALRAAPTVTVNKVVVNDDLTTPEDDPGRFDLQVDGVTRLSDAGHGDATGQVAVAAGASVTVGEVAGTDTDLDDYVSDVSCDSGKGSSDGTSHTFTIGAGEDVICTITNTRKAVLTVDKVLVPDTDGGTFNLEIDGATAGTGGGVGDGGTTGPVKLAPGDYTVGESGASGTDLDDYVVEIDGDCAADGTISLTSGQVASCTITNTRKATITVNKVLSPATDPGRFNLEIDGVTAGTGGNVGDGGTTGAIKLAPGQYTVGESAVVGTDLNNYDSKVVCDAGKGSTDPGTSHTFTVGAGENVTCTLTNTRKVAGFVFYLHHNPSPSGASHSSTRPANPLVMNGTANDYTGSLPNYDSGANSDPGRQISKDSDNVNQTDVTKVITWKSPAFSQAVVITKAISTTPKVIDFFVRHKTNDTSKVVSVKFYLSDCPATLSAASGSSSGCTRLASGVYSRPTGSGFTTPSPHIELTWLTTLPAVHTIVAGRVLELKVINPDPLSSPFQSSQDDLTVLYDTTDHDARLTFAP